MSAVRGGVVSIPFCVEDLAEDGGVYRVEAWMGGRVGELPTVYVSPGGQHCAQMDVGIAAGTSAPLDLYLYLAEAVLPTARLRLWIAE